MFHLTGFSKNYCCSMFLKQSKLSFSFVSVLPKRNCFEMLNRAYIFISGALPPQKKSRWKNEEISPYLRCPGPIQTKTFHLRKKLTMKESREQPKSEVPKLHTDKHQWSGIVLLLAKSCSKNGVTVCCEEIMLNTFALKLCYKML